MVDAVFAFRQSADVAPDELGRRVAIAVGHRKLQIIVAKVFRKINQASWIRKADNDMQKQFPITKLYRTLCIRQLDMKKV